MPVTASKTIGVKVASGNEGEYVIIRNITSGGQKTVKLNSSKEVIINSSPDFEWANGDNIQAEMTGRVKGTSSTTITGGGASIILSVSADSSLKSGSL